MIERNEVNQDLRDRVTKDGIGYGELSDALGVSESTLYQWLRHELSLKQRQAITTALKQLRASDGGT